MILTKLIPFSEIASLAADLHAKGKKIVFTNGCFDIIHAGHVIYLEDAANLGDCLILGLNSDASVRRLKGNTRPIVPQEERSIVAAALEMVDYVCIFEEDTPYELIKLVQPNVLVKGGDWAVDEIVGADLVLAAGGEVRSLNYEAGLSTTSIIDRIRQSGEE
jgi:D-beta-D-heptose 7-phosphate kinase/D-beta-D-heptose 1-phosphate adenosyltransferase